MFTLMERWCQQINMCLDKHRDFGGIHHSNTTAFSIAFFPHFPHFFRISPHFFANPGDRIPPPPPIVLKFCCFLLAMGLPSQRALARTFRATNRVFSLGCGSFHGLVKRPRPGQPALCSLETLSDGHSLLDPFCLLECCMHGGGETVYPIWQDFGCCGYVTHHTAAPMHVQGRSADRGDALHAPSWPMRIEGKGRARGGQAAIGQGGADSLASAGGPPQ